MVSLPGSTPPKQKQADMGDNHGLMNLEDARRHYGDHSAKASDVARQLGFAGIAIVWIFRRGAPPGDYSIPPDLLLPTILIVVTLACDFLQYTVASFCWGIYARHKEKTLADPEQRFSAPDKINWAGNTFYSIKLVSIAAAYFFLLRYLLKLFA